MNYYLDTVTEKSQKELYALHKLCDFILIGGWAVYLYTKSLKSKDIDIIVDFNTLSTIEKVYGLTKNIRLTKYEAFKEEVQIDIYCPYYSKIGLPVENLIDRTYKLEGFTVIDINYLMILKIYTLGQRGRRPKGRKDLIDIISLHRTGKINYPEVKNILDQYRFTCEINDLKTILNENFSLPELSLNQHFFSRIKKELLTHLS